MPTYRDIDALDGFSLEESWILGVTVPEGRVAIRAESALRLDSPKYLPVADGGVTTLVGTVVLSGVTAVEWRMAGTPPAMDADGVLDYAAFEQWLGDGEAKHELSGEFGSLRETRSECGSCRTSASTA